MCCCRYRPQYMSRSPTHGMFAVHMISQSASCYIRKYPGFLAELLVMSAVVSTFIHLLRCTYSCLRHCKARQPTWRQPGSWRSKLASFMRMQRIFLCAWCRYMRVTHACRKLLGYVAGAWCWQQLLYSRPRAAPTTRIQCLISSPT